GVTSRVNVGPGGVQDDTSSYDAAISADGRFVAFTSSGTTLVPGGNNGFQHAFVRDRQAGETSRMSVGSGGTLGHGDSFVPAISAGGRFVAFFSVASNLVSGDGHLRSHVFVDDQQTGGASRLMSVGGGSARNGKVNCVPAISADGRFVVFTSSSS